jgi:hypothetical protein
MISCPNCGELVTPGATDCARCGYVLTAAKPESDVGVKPRRQRLYGLVIACVGIAVVVYAFKESFAGYLALSVPAGARERVAWMYTQTILTPMAQPAQPLPALALNVFPVLRSSLLLHYGLVALVLLQGALLLRRVAICIAARKVIAPPALARAPKILLLIGLLSWCIAVFVEILPRLVALVATRPIEGLGLAAGVVSAFILPLVWIPAVNLLGPVFFTLELHSVVREGVRPVVSSRADDTASRPT